jgi:hypothetical protein
MENDIAQKLTAIESYAKVYGWQAVYSALKECGVGARTFRNWLRNPEKAANATLLKFHPLEKTLEKLADVSPAGDVHYYRYVLSRMHESELSQDNIKNYLGRYDVYTNIKFEEIPIKSLVIVNKDKHSKPSMPIFLLNVKQSHPKNEKISKRIKKAEGFVFLQAGYIIFSAVSDYLHIFMVVSGAVRLEREVLKGFINIHDKEKKKVHISSITLCHESFKRNYLSKFQEDERKIEDLKLNDAIMKELGVVYDSI